MVDSTVNSIDIMFVDLDNTFWNGTLGEDLDVKVSRDHFTSLKKLAGRGISAVALTNNSLKNLAIQKIEDNCVFSSIFAGFIYSSGPKVLRVDRILSRLSIPWSKVAIVDDDLNIRNDFAKKGALVFADFNELKAYNWESVNSIVSSGSISNRLLARRYSVELTSLSPDDACNGFLHSYLKQIELKTQIVIEHRELTDRIPELFYRTNQMQFNKPMFKTDSVDDIRETLQKHIHEGGKMAIVEVSIGGMNLGIQGAFLYKHKNNVTDVLNSTFSCSVIPFRIVESLALSEFINQMLLCSEEIRFHISLTERNERIVWLLEDHGGIIISEDVCVIKDNICIPFEMEAFRGDTSSCLEEDGVPPITTFYDDHISYLLDSKDVTNVLDIGCGFGEILGRKRNYEIAETIVNSGGKYVKGDLQPKDPHTEHMDVENLSSYENNALDLIFCLELLEHVNNPCRALMELLRVLCEGGHLFLSVPSAAYPYHAFDNDVSRFSSSFLFQCLQMGGKIEKYYIQKYNGREIRTIILMKKSTAGRLNGAMELFSDENNRIMLPQGLVYYSYVEEIGVIKMCKKIRTALCCLYSNQIFKKREHIKLATSLMGIILAVTALFLAMQKLKAGALATQHSTIVSMLTSESHYADGVEAAAVFQQKANNHLGKDLSRLIAGVMYGQTLNNRNLTNIDLSSNDLKVILYDTTFRNCTFNNSQFRNSELKWVNLILCHLDNADMRDITVVGGRWQVLAVGANFSGMRIRGSELCLGGLQFNDCSVWSRSELIESDFQQTELTKVIFFNATLEKCVFDGAVLKNCQFDMATIDNVSFRGCTFENCKFENKAILINCDFTGASFDSMCSFRNSSLGTTTFKDSDITSVMFEGATVSSENDRCSDLLKLKARIE